MTRSHQATDDDTVDFASVLAGSYDAGTQYDALDGNDTVILPDTLAAAMAASRSLLHGGAAHRGSAKRRGLVLCSLVAKWWW